MSHKVKQWVLSEEITSNLIIVHMFIKTYSVLSYSFVSDFSNPAVCSPPDSVYAIFQARTLEGLPFSTPKHTLMHPYLVNLSSTVKQECNVNPRHNFSSSHIKASKSLHSLSISSFFPFELCKFCFMCFYGMLFVV